MNGALHWLVRRMQNPRYNLIMSFNLGDETVFYEVPVPKVLEIENHQNNQFYSDLSLYEPYNQRKIWNLQIDTDCFYLDNYMESLVLLDVKRARVIKKRKRKNKNMNNMKVAVLA
ncbi:hypothetical protein CFP56_032509 [Quercus suber]|uniref:Uncharacterized protein n=1 Tax=Quercus suber TaxID=58331 RepID=A0AAW0JH35_QUESU